MVHYLVRYLTQLVSQSTIPYLKTDIDNYISILKMVANYYKKNDYKFFSKSNNIEKYNDEVNSILELKTRLENDKVKYTDTWNEEAKKQRKALKSKSNE